MRPGHAATLVTRSGISLCLAPRTGTACTATPGDIVRLTAPTPTTSARRLALVQSPSATPYHDALTPSSQMTLGQTMTDSMTHMMTSTGRHRTTLLECEAGKLHLKKGVMLRLCVLDYYFLPSPPSPLHVVATSFYGLCTSFSPYLLHASPSPLLYHLCVHQHPLTHNLCAPFIPTSPHCYLMYHCTVCARFPPLLHVYYHAPYTCLSSISTGQCSALYYRLNFLSNQVVFHSLVC